MSAAAQHPLQRPVADALRPLWRWWSGELSAMTPAALKRLLSGRRGRVVVMLDHHRVTLYQAAGAQRRRLGAFDLAAATPREARGLLGGSADDLVLELPAEAALRRVVALPAAAEANLAEVVSFELERHTPFRRTEAYHGFRAVGRAPARQRILIELTVVPRAAIDEALTNLLALGLEIGEVRVAAESANAEASPNLLPARSAARTSRLPRLVLSVLAAAAAGLAVAAVALPMVRGHQEVAQLEAALDAAKRQAAESAALQKKIDAALADRGFLAGRRQKVVAVSALLDTLTRLLPDDTWLTELRIGGSELDIAGIGASASAVVALIDGAPGLSDAAFRSPVTQDRQRREQFDIGAHIGAAAKP